MNAPLVAESAAHSQFGPPPAPTVSEEEQHACSQHTQSICLLPDRRRTERFAFGVLLAKLQMCILVRRYCKLMSSTWFLHDLTCIKVNKTSSFQTVFWISSVLHVKTDKVCYFCHSRSVIPSGAVWITTNQLLWFMLWRLQTLPIKRVQWINEGCYITLKSSTNRRSHGGSQLHHLSSIKTALELQTSWRNNAKVLLDVVGIVGILNGYSA